MSDATHKQPELIVGRRYKLDRRLGQGGMGVVWEAHLATGGPPVALKLIAPALARNRIAVARCLREATALSRLVSPHVVKILDHGMDVAFGPYIVMELLVGEDLAARIARKGLLPMNETLQICEQVADALTEAHESDLIHRDLKPANVFLAKDADGVETAKLLDFGTVKADSPLMYDGSRTAPGMVIGTLSRMSPEQLRGEVVDTTTDVWGLALCVFEALTGVTAVDPALPFGQLVIQICHQPLPPPSQFNPDLPPSIDAWFRKSTARRSEERYATVKEQVEALAEACVRMSGVVKKTDEATTTAALQLRVQAAEPERLLSLPPLVARSIERELPDVIRVVEAREQETSRHTLVPGGRRGAAARIVAFEEMGPAKPAAPTLFPSPSMGGDLLDPWARTGS